MESEDCLFLDVYVPSTVSIPANGTSLSLNGNGTSTGAPVIVYMHGGGFTLSSKQGLIPSGLIHRSVELNGEGVIFVAMNYRLGALGWLAGPSFQGESGLQNAGLFDQRAAFNWVKQYIHLFGGDPNRVTGAGSSAGAGSLLHHLTAYGGRTSPAEQIFQQALFESVAFIPNPSHEIQERGYQGLLSAANVSNLAELRALPEAQLLAANKLAQADTFYGNFIYGPTPDGSYVPDMPGKLLSQGAFNHNVTVQLNHNTHEANKYTDPTANNDTAFDTYMRLYFPKASNATLEYISQTLYPATYPTADYTTPFERLRLATQHFTFTCNSNWISHAFNNNTHSSLFSVPPGNHTQDASYIFYPNTLPPVANATTALWHQGYLMSFVQTGDPNTNVKGQPEYPVYGAENELLNMNQTIFDVVEDDTLAGRNAERCAWWQKALYY